MSAKKQMPLLHLGMRVNIKLSDNMTNKYTTIDMPGRFLQLNDKGALVQGDDGKIYLVLVSYLELVGD